MNGNYDMMNPEERQAVFWEEFQDDKWKALEAVRKAVYPVGEASHRAACAGLKKEHDRLEEAYELLSQAQRILHEVAMGEGVE